MEQEYDGQIERGREGGVLDGTRDREKGERERRVKEREERDENVRER